MLSTSSKMQCALVPYFVDMLSYPSVQRKIKDEEPTCDVDFNDVDSVVSLAVLMSEQSIDYILDFLDDNFMVVISDLVEVKLSHKKESTEWYCGVCDHLTTDGKVSKGYFKYCPKCDEDMYRFELVEGLNNENV